MREIRIAQLEREIGAGFEVGAPRHERSRPCLEAFPPDARVARLGDPHRPHRVPPRDSEPLPVGLGFGAAELAQASRGDESDRPPRPDATTIERSTSDASRSATRAGVEAVARADLLGRLEPERRRKDGEPAEERLLRLAQQLVAPLDHARERALSLGDHLRATAEQREAIGQALRDLLRRQRPEPRRRELEREREAVEALAHLCDRAECLLVELEVATRRLAPLDEEPHRVRGRASGATSRTDSPGTPSGSRLVASSRTPGHDESSATASSPTAAVTCSQLSRTSRSSRRRRWLCRKLSAEADRPSNSELRMPTASATASATRAGSRIGASSTSQAPSECSSHGAARRPRSRDSSCPRRPGR